jgi:hypothetical protein
VAKANTFLFFNRQLKLTAMSCKIPKLHAGLQMHLLTGLQVSNAPQLISPVLT